MNITVVGTGYVGLVTGCCLAEAGHKVTCVDNNEAKVEAMRAGEVPIFEPTLEELMKRNSSEGRLSFTTSLREGVSEAKAIFLALPTPPHDDGSADLSAVLAVAGKLGKILPEHYCVVINKSTVPVGTAEAVRDAIAKDAKSKFSVVSNPEFLREGKAVQDFMEPERVVVGVSNERDEQIMREIYESFVNDKRPLYVTDQRTAELSKYAANTFLVTKISFMNEIAQLCERMGADVDLVRQIIGSDSRIGQKFLYPGIGSGGSCFPKDVRALKHMSDQQDYDFKLLAAAMAINDQQKHVLVYRLLDHFDGQLAGKTFALWGLAFKPGTDDIREAPALSIIDELLEHSARVVAYDPEAADNVRQLYAGKEGVEIVDDKFEALEGADALLIATEWPEFAEADLSQIREKLAQPAVFDGRNVFQPEQMRKAGFSYYSIGRRPVVQ
ncbi:MAG TPA: UDP-glucose/GDP-mannose dehydrogenase family protein [Candidatus Saccharimonadia bacterium]|nr:UDP-glucose/GDP-mannose dehydrogenase family protein [Candidatus Saccharimonadia bacterium]